MSFVWSMRGMRPQCQLRGASAARRPRNRSPGLMLPRPLFYHGNMTFDLTPQMIDKIGFAMEDQDKQYLIHADTGELVATRDLARGAPEEKYLPLPKWGSAEGYHLMESFVTSLYNPVYRDLLAAALSEGKGVFRAFKNVLKKNHEIEKLWFTYKEKKLRAVIIAWYNLNREAHGLSKMPPEPEETEELVASDFSITWGIGAHAGEIAALDRDAFVELFPKLSASAVEARYREKRAEFPGFDSRSSLILVAENPEGELAGFAWGVVSGDSVHIAQLAVSREYRGIGLGEALMKRMLKDIRSRGIKTITTELSGKSLRFSDFFQSLGFTPLSEILECNLDQLGY